MPEKPHRRGCKWMTDHIAFFDEKRRDWHEAPLVDAKLFPEYAALPAREKDVLQYHGYSCPDPGQVRTINISQGPSS